MWAKPAFYLLFLDLYTAEHHDLWIASLQLVQSQEVQFNMDLQVGMQYQLYTLVSYSGL